MRFLILLLLCGVCFAQEKPNVTVQKMSDAEFKQLDDASAAMQKAGASVVLVVDLAAIRADPRFGEGEVGHFTPPSHEMR